MFYINEYIYISGQWAWETVSLPKAIEKTYGKGDARHKIFVIQGVKHEEGGANVTMALDHEGIFGL